MLQRSLIVAVLALALVALTLPSAQAIPIPSKQCAYRCGPTVPCSTTCWAQIQGGGPWFGITCGQYYDEWEWEGGGSGSCQGLTGPVAESDLDRFLTSLESLAEDEATTATP